MRDEWRSALGILACREAADLPIPSTASLESSELQCACLRQSIIDTDSETKLRCLDTHFVWIALQRCRKAHQQFVCVLPAQSDFSFERRLHDLRFGRSPLLLRSCRPLF